MERSGSTPALRPWSVDAFSGSFFVGSEKDRTMPLHTPRMIWQPLPGQDTAAAPDLIPTMSKRWSAVSALTDLVAVQAKIAAKRAPVPLFPSQQGAVVTPQAAVVTVSRFMACVAAQRGSSGASVQAVLDLNEAFFTADTNGDGVVSIEELSAVVSTSRAKAGGVTNRLQELSILVRGAAAELTGTVLASVGQPHILELFQLLDSDRDGNITM